MGGLRDFLQILSAFGRRGLIGENGQPVILHLRNAPIDLQTAPLTGRSVQPKYACVGGFTVGGRFGGCYTRLDGPITSARATYVATLSEPDAAARRR